MVIASYICLGLALCAMGFYIAGFWAGRSWLKQARPPLPDASTDGPQALLPVSILKPLKGCDPEMYEAFRSHCELDYPDYEIIFGVSSADDEAVPYVERLQKEYPLI